MAKKRSISYDVSHDWRRAPMVWPAFAWVFVGGLATGVVLSAVPDSSPAKPGGCDPRPTTTRTTMVVRR